MKKFTFSLLLFAAMANYSFGQVTTNWVIGNGYFSDPASWNNGVPGQNDTAVFDAGGVFDTMLTMQSEIFAMRVQNGSNVSLRGSDAVSTNFAFVDGAGVLSIREDTGMDVAVLRVADVSDGQLVVEDQNTLKITNNAIVGRDFNVMGFVNVGIEARLEALDLTVAQSGNGIVTMAQGSTGFVSNLTLGQLAMSNGALTMVNTEWDSDSITVGDSGFGNLIVDDNSSLETDSITVGANVNSDGNAFFTGNSNLEIANEFQIGMNAASIGNVTIANANVNVMGGELVVGDNGTGTLQIENDGVLTSGFSIIGKSSQGSGDVTMEGTGSWNCMNDLTIGALSDGEIDLFDSASLIVNGITRIGDNHDGDVHLRPGSAAKLSGTSDIGIGIFAHGVLSVNSGTVTTDTFVVSSVEAGSTSQINLIGPNSFMDCGADCIVANRGTSTINVLNDANLDVEADFIMAKENGSTAIGNFSNANITVGGNFIVGDLQAIGTADAGFTSGQFTVVGDTLINTNSCLEIRDPDFSTDEIYNEGELQFSNAAANQIHEFSIDNEPSGKITVDTAGPLTIDDNVANNGEIIVGPTRTFVANDGYSGNGSITGSGLIQISGFVNPGTTTIGTLNFQGTLFLNNAILLTMTINNTSDLDRLNVLGDLDISNFSWVGFHFTDGFTPTLGDVYPFCTVSGVSTGEFHNFAEGDVVRLFGNLALVMRYSSGAGGNDIALEAVDSAGLVLLGDVNLDGSVNLLDVAPFVDLLPTGAYQPEADCNRDGTIDLLDVEPFVNLLSGM